MVGVIGSNPLAPTKTAAAHLPEKPTRNGRLFYFLSFLLLVHLRFDNVFVWVSAHTNVVEESIVCPQACIKKSVHTESALSTDRAISGTR
jgi:hypothetical protein